MGARFRYGNFFQKQRFKVLQKLSYILIIDIILSNDGPALFPSIYHQYYCCIKTSSL